MLVARHNEVKYITYMRDATMLGHAGFGSCPMPTEHRLFTAVPKTEVAGTTFQATERCPGFTESKRARVMKRRAKPLRKASQ